MFETEEERAERIAGKRDAARRHPGVNYDARIDRFTAEIYIDGARKWLGSYHEIEQAIDAYQQAKQERPPRAGSFNAVYRAFREAHGGEKGTPPTGAVLEYDGQRYKFHGVTFRKNGAGSSYSYYQWESRCKSCDELFLTMTAAPVSVCKGITRNCPEHRRGSKRTKAPTSERDADAAVAAAPKPLTGVKAVIASEVEVLSMVYDTLPVSELANRLLPALGSFRIPNAVALEQYLRNWQRDDGECPFVVYDDVASFL